jgi:CHASE2 domain-containing sensor protein
MPSRRRTNADRATERSSPFARLWRPLSISCGLRSDDDAERIRTVTLGWLFGIGFALLGMAGHVPGAGLLGESPFELDQALRTLAHGWFDTGRARPVTIVDIDAATYAAWHSPLATPRAELARMLGIVTAASPEAVVVDIDLSGGGTAVAATTDADDAALRLFLAGYRGAAPLLFPKRIELDEDGRRWETTSAYDDVFAANDRLQWAHASFATSGGVVRDWQRWIEVCVAPVDEPVAGAGDIVVAHTRWLPAMAEAIAGSKIAAASRQHATSAPALTNDCRTDAPSVSSRLLIGPRLSGDAMVPSGDAQSVSARMLLDPELQIDAAQLFGSRVVLIGATHPAARDYWLTPSGVLPGVEVIANTVRFLDLQDEAARTRGWHRVVVLAFFVFFAIATWKLRGLPKLFVLIAGTLVLVAFAIEGFGYYGVFDALETAIVLTVLYKAAAELGGMIEDWRQQWRASRGTSWRFFRTLKAVSLRQP